MKSFTNERFRKLYRALPEDVRKQAREAYRKFMANPQHPSLHFKRVNNTRPIFSARINVDYRVLGVLDEDEIVWFWIGSHSDYDKILKNI
jgi:mRNA-degrading endonuclease RelE of RelBE toxin-antitoxin system